MNSYHKWLLHPSKFIRSFNEFANGGIVTCFPADGSEPFEIDQSEPDIMVHWDHSQLECSAWLSMNLNEDADFDAWELCFKLCLKELGYEPG